MLFVAEYEFGWDSLEAAMARRLEWDDLKPSGFRYVGEYIWQDGDPPFRGIAIFEADSVDDVNSFVVNYGPILTMKVHPASDVVSAIASFPGATTPAPAKRRAASAKRSARR